MSQKQIISLLVFATVTIITFWLGSCTKENATEPLEPISLIQPDTPEIRLFAGDSQQIQIKFTTDRPINWIKGMYDIDSLGNVGYVPAYPDTLFYLPLDTANPRVNRYEYYGVYYIPADLPPFSTVRFDFHFHAGKSSFTVGQNYPAGIVTGNKQFRIDVR